MTSSFAPSASRVRVQILVPEPRAITLAERLKETLGNARGPDVNGLMLVAGGIAVEELRELAARLDPGWRTLLRIEPAAY
jgi:hypothetical protein